MVYSYITFVGQKWLWTYLTQIYHSKLYTKVSNKIWIIISIYIQHLYNSYGNQPPITWLLFSSNIQADKWKKVEMTIGIEQSLAQFIWPFKTRRYIKIQSEIQSAVGRRIWKRRIRKTKKYFCDIFSPEQ